MKNIWSYKANWKSPTSAELCLRRKFLTHILVKFCYKRLIASISSKESYFIQNIVNIFGEKKRAFFK